MGIVKIRYDGKYRLKCDLCDDNGITPFKLYADAVSAVEDSSYRIYDIAGESYLLCNHCFTKYEQEKKKKIADKKKADRRKKQEQLKGYDDKKLLSDMCASFLKDYRVDNGLSQHDVGEAMGVSQVQVSNYERGKSLVSIDKVLSVMSEFGCSQYENDDFSYKRDDNGLDIKVNLRKENSDE